SDLYILKSGTVTRSVRRSHGIVAIGAGYRILNGRRTDQPCVRIYVEPDAVATSRKQLPEKVEGVPVDITPSDVFKPLRGSPYGGRIRPARPGCSIGYRGA